MTSWINDKPVDYPFEVQIADTHRELLPTYRVIHWLDERGWEYEIDMHSGTAGYTSLYFKVAEQAILCKLTWGGK